MWSPRGSTPTSRTPTSPTRQRPGGPRRRPGGSGRSAGQSRPGSLWLDGCWSWHSRAVARCTLGCWVAGAARGARIAAAARLPPV
eukprot:9697201-Alexandrium_andersonii.AAC.1